MLALGATPILIVAACGGTTGREDLPAAPSSSASDGGLGTDAPPGAEEDELFDAVVPVTDRELPDIQPPPAVDATIADGGTGAASDAASPCTEVPCAKSGPNSVECYGNDGGACSATEAVFVDIDMDAGRITAADAGDSGAFSVPGSSSCYACLLTFGCIDDDLYGDSCHECADVGTAICLAGNAPSPGPVDGEPTVQSCLDTLSCMVGADPVCADTDPPAACFCGTATGTACLNPGAANGACLEQEINGLPGVGGTCINTYPAPLDCIEGNPTMTQEQFTDTALPAGMANTLVGCAVADCAMACGL